MAGEPITSIQQRLRKWQLASREGLVWTSVPSLSPYCPQEPNSLAVSGFCPEEKPLPPSALLYGPTPSTTAAIKPGSLAKPSCGPASQPVSQNWESPGVRGPTAKIQAPPPPAGGWVVCNNHKCYLASRLQPNQLMATHRTA